MKFIKLFFCLFALLFFEVSLNAQNIPKIISDEDVMSENYLPDFSYAGYHNGEVSLPKTEGKVYNAEDFGVIPNDKLDDTKALIKAIDSISKFEGNVTLQLPKGRIILSDIIYITRSNFVLKGTGTGENGTELYFPRPLMYVPNPESLQELREYLIKFNKRQKEKENNINLPFSQYAWSGGYIWTKVSDVRVKPYLQKYEKPYNVLAEISQGKRGEFSFKASNIKNLKVGDVVELQLFNKDGKDAAIISDLYKTNVKKIGGHHWNFPDLPLVKQQVRIVKVKGKTITINAPLTIDINPSYKAQLVEWKHLTEVGIQDFKITFPQAPRVAHHVEPGFNGIYLTRVYNSWVNNIVIDNADSGVLTEEIANTTIKNITTQGENLAHYTVAMSGTYNVLAENVKVYNKAVHPLSFNTLATKCVYLNCEVFVDPILDQHSGANHQNLFDNIKVHLNVNEDNSYPIFAGGGAGYWKPSHGAFSTFWNINVTLLNDLNNQNMTLLNGMKDGPFARVIGVNGNSNFKIEYGPKAHIEFTNNDMEIVPSLYEYQLKKRINNK